jgi:hypothetical protein
MPIILLPTSSSADRSRLISSDFIRSRTLERLYERKAAVEELIRSLEDYQRVNSPQTIDPIEFSEPLKCWLTFAR